MRHTKDKGTANVCYLHISGICEKCKLYSLKSNSTSILDPMLNAYRFFVTNLRICFVLCSSSAILFREKNARHLPVPAHFSSLEICTKTNKTNNTYHEYC